MSLSDSDQEAIKLEMQFNREKMCYFSPDYVPADIAHLDLARPRTPERTKEQMLKTVRKLKVQLQDRIKREAKTEERDIDREIAELADGMRSLRPLPMAPDPHNEANKVYAVFARPGLLLGILTSPVDAAETVKGFPGSFTQTCVLNAI